MSKKDEKKHPPGPSGWKFTEYHIRPNVFLWSPSAHAERLEVKTRREIAMEKYKEAQIKIEDEKFLEAEKLLENAIAAWPDNHKFLSALASCICYHQKDPERSLPWFDSAIDMHDCASYHSDRAQALACMGALDEALQDASSALAGDPKNGVYMRSRAMIYERQGQFFEAMNDYTAAIPLLKEMAEPIYECIFNRGFCHKLMGHSEDAIKDFEAAYALAPFSVTVKTLLGGMHLQKKRYNDAQMFFSSAQFSADESPASYNNLGLILYMMATDPDAMKDKILLALGRKEEPSKTGEENEESSAPKGDAESSSDDDEAFERSLATVDIKATAVRNEDPKKWAFENLQGGATEQDLNLERRAMLEQALAHFTTALELHEKRCKSSDQVKKADPHAHAVHLHAPANIKEGLLLVLGATPHIPGTAVVHDDEIEDGEIQYNRGLANLSLGMLEAAEEDFHAALKANPTHAHFPHYRAVVLARKGELKEAVKWNMSALTMNGRYYPALYHLGLILHILMRNAEAIQRLDVGLSIHTCSWKIMEARGRVLQELDRHQEAILSLSAALKQLDIEAEAAPSLRARLHFAIALSAIACHQRELLRSSLKQAQLHGQDPASIFSLRGLLAHREKKLDKAMKYTSRAIRLAPQEARFLFDRSQVYMESKEFESAITDMTDSLRLLPNCPSLIYHRGMAYFGMGNDSSACEDFDAAARLVLESSITEMGQNLKPAPLITDPRLWEGAKVKSASTAPPDLSASLWYHLGCMRARLGNSESAAEAFEFAAQLLPTHPAVIHELAKAYQAAGCPEKSLPNFNKVLQLQPNNANALFRRGLVHRNLKQYSSAAADFEKARRIEPNHPVFQVDYLRSGLPLVELCRPGCESAFSSGAAMT